MSRTVACLLTAILMLFSGAAQGLPTDRTLGQMSHTRWTTDDNAPSDIQALAQTRDGFLWIGSSTGLYRFDGLTFERIDTIGPESSVTALLSTQDGRLLIGLQNGHLLLLRNGRQTDVTPSSLSKNIQKIVEDRSGGIWMQTIAPDMGLARYLHGRWKRFGPKQGVPEDGFIKTTVATRDGAIWVLTQNLVLVLKPGNDRFDIVLSAVNDKIEGMFEDATGRVWVADHRKGLWQISGGPGQHAADIHFTDRTNRIRGFYVDRDGAIWGNVISDGIFRILPPDSTHHQKERFERYGSMRGLSSDSVNALIEDHEGTIWIGTSGGLDRFRPSNVVLADAIPAKSANGYDVFADHAGTIYITDSDTLYRVLPGGSPIKVLNKLNNPMATCEGARGTIWVAVSGGIDVVRKELVQRMKPPTDSDYMRCQGDSESHPWFLTTLGELFKHGSKGWERQKIAIRNSFATRFTFDAEGRPLAFFENVGLVRQDGDTLSSIWPVSRIPGGRIGPLYLGNSGIMVGGVAGLARIRGGRVDLLGPRYPWFKHVTGIIETPTGDTWVQSSLGIFRFSTTALQRAFDHPGSALHPARFDAHDGLQGTNQIDYADNGAALGGDGRVWFTTTAGIVWIDPAHLLRNTIPPPVAINRVTVDGHVLRGAHGADLPKGAKSIQIDFTALSLAVPERVQFRYRMDGVDEQWINPGAQRRAIYQNLAPGDYTFTVIASNNDGVWNTKGATIRLTLPPTFLQSWTFKLLCTAAAALVLWVLYRVRLNRITTRLKEQMETRLIERERIARELHDTLLQGVHGLILRFKGIADRLPREQVPSRLMEKALERAEDILVEGRERVHGLRSAPLSSDLSASFAAAVAHAELPTGTAVELHESGQESVVDNIVHEELVWVLREALSNVARHSGATLVDIRLAYRWNRLIVSITDNGRGMDSDRPLAGSNRHFGLIGMRERARRISARLKIEPGPDRTGTQVTVTVPARIAYPSATLHRVRALFGLSKSALTP